EFAGRDGAISLADTWVLRSDTWTQVVPSASILRSFRR
ncbi:MAG: hypothetical protein ACI89X_004956, partial [Planctomycetota bacterium]